MSAEVSPRVAPFVSPNLVSFTPMKFHRARLSALLLLVGSPLLSADELTPRMADSPDAQRLRSLTLLSNPTALSSPKNLALVKARTLRALSDALRARVAVIDARLLNSPSDDLEVRRLNTERDTLLKREREVGELLKKLAGETR